MQARARPARLASLLEVRERAFVISVLLDRTQRPAEQVHVQLVLQDTIVKAAPARLDVLCTAHHQHSHIISRAVSAMQGTAGRTAETAALAIPVPFARGPPSRIVLDHH